MLHTGLSTNGTPPKSACSLTLFTSQSPKRFIFREKCATINIDVQPYISKRPKKGAIMTVSTELLLANYKKEVTECLGYEYRLMAIKGDGQETRKAIKYQYYLEELDAAREFLQGAAKVSKVSRGMVQILNESGSDFEDIFDGAFVRIVKVKKTGVYFLSLCPVSEI